MPRHVWAKIRAFLPVLAALLLVIGVACGAAATATPRSTTPVTDTPAPAPTNTPGPKPTSVPAAAPVAQAKYGGDIRMAAYADTKDWDPLGSGSLSSVQAYSQLYNQIVQFDTVDPGKVVCDLCSDWQVGNGGQTFTFNLRPNIKWQDGRDLTAEDVGFSMARYMDPEVSIGRSGLFRNYTNPVEENGVRIVDKDTVEFNLSFASGAFMKFLALDYARVLPKHLLEQDIDLNQAENIIANSAGSGPFMLTEYQRGNRYSVIKNPNYFKEGRPYFDSIDHFIIVDTGTLIAQFKAGQLEMMNGGFSNLTPTEYLQLDADTVGSSNGHITAHELSGTFNVLLMVNPKKEPFTDIRVRKAMYLALDRQQSNDLLQDNTAAGPCPMMNMGYSFEECANWPGLRPKDSPGGQADIAEAKRLMEEAGFPNGFSASYDARQVGNYPDVCTVVKQQLEDVLGITGDIKTHESAAGYALFGTARAADATGDWELACQGEGMTVLDADGLLGGVYLKGATRNYTDWETPFIREKFEAQKVEQDLDRRREILKEIEDYLVFTDPDDLSSGYVDNPSTTLYWGKFFWLVGEDIRGFNVPQTVQYGFKHEDLWLDR